MAQAWYEPPGALEDLLPVRDGSLHLTYDPRESRLRTWKERESVTGAAGSTATKAGLATP
jgi:hypothetical protein